MDTATKRYFGHAAVATYACRADNSNGHGAGRAL